VHRLLDSLVCFRQLVCCTLSKPCGNLVPQPRVLSSSLITPSHWHSSPSQSTPSRSSSSLRCSEREINRGDRAVWAIDSDGNVGLLNSGKVNARFAYDIVFPDVSPLPCGMTHTSVNRLHCQAAKGTSKRPACI
jgi:hypothetical protein